jgi:hypothetical protein
MHFLHFCLLHSSILLIYAHVFSDYCPGSSIFRIRKHQRQSWRCSKYSFSDIFFILDKISFFSIDIRFQKDKSSMNVTLIKQFFNEKKYLIKGKFISSNFYRLLRLKKLSILNLKKIMSRYFKSKQYHRKNKSDP